MSAYTYVWEFTVRPDAREEFRARYGPSGPWITLFRLAQGYRETLLLQDREDSDRFLTVDRWESEAAFDSFRTQYRATFDALDTECEHLTLSERQVGEFLEVAP
jgi:heme-degrading monooxygenase HmoA